MPEKKALMCMPASFKGYIVPGSLPHRCSKCGQLVWVAPSALLIMHDNPGMEILCMPCALEQMKKDKDFEIEGITPAQAEEINEYLERERRDDSTLCLLSEEDIAGANKNRLAWLRSLSAGG